MALGKELGDDLHLVRKQPKGNTTKVSEVGPETKEIVSLQRIWLARPGM